MQKYCFFLNYARKRSIKYDFIANFGVFSLNYAIKGWIYRFFLWHATDLLYMVILNYGAILSQNNCTTMKRILFLAKE